MGSVVVDVHDRTTLLFASSVFLVIEIVVLHLRWELLLVRLSVIDCDHGVSGQREKKYFLEWLIIYCRRPLKRTIELLTVDKRLVGQGIDRVCCPEVILDLLCPQVLFAFCMCFAKGAERYGFRDV